MFLFHTGQYMKPSRVGEPKDKDYHAKMAKYCIANGFENNHRRFVEKASMIKSFYSGEQWVEDEDLEAFLKDETGGETGRIKVAFNIIRPLIEQYRGNAININMNAAVKTTSGKSKSRKDTALAEKLAMTTVVNGFPNPDVQERLRMLYGVGGDGQETTQMFENAYVDLFVDQMNKLLQYSANLNEFQRMQLPLAEDMSFSGLAVAEAFEHGGHLRFEHFPSVLFFWDRSAYRKDLKDAMFQGRLDLIDPTLVMERWPHMNDRDKRNMEEYVNMLNQQQNATSAMGVQNIGGFRHLSGYGGINMGAVRIPQYKVFWRDIESYTYGFVEDEEGFPILEKIGYTRPGEDSPKYTMEDVIDPPDSVDNRRVFKGEKTVVRDVDVLRYCVIIPQEIFAGIDKEHSSKMEPADLVLEYGIYPYQEEDYHDYNNIKFPFKVQTWAYVDGDVLSPIDSVINPQRFINRILSVQESHVNNSGGSGSIISQSAIMGTNQDEDDIANAMKRGKPVVINDKGKGVPNAVGNYDATPGQGTYKMGEMVSGMYDFVQRMTGVNDPLQGQSTGPDQLVGVTQLMIQKGSLVQEPFYDALVDIFMQMYQHIARVGKEIYLDNKRELNIITGSGGDEVLILSDDIRHEDFRTFVERENPDEIQQSVANQEILMFSNLGLLTPQDVADLWGRSTPSEVRSRLRLTAAAAAQADKQMAQQQADAINQQMQEAQAQQNAEMMQKERFKAADNATKLTEIAQKAQAADQNFAAQINSQNR